jgi:hypothetical protein
MIRRMTPSLFLCVLLSACGGGGGSALPQAHVTAAPIPTPKANPQKVTVSITIPAGTRNGSGRRRRPQYISVNTNSAAISVNGGTPVIAGLSANSANCTSSPAGVTCTLSIDAPVGPDTFVEQMYASVNGTGPVLSQSTTSATIVAGIANTVNMTLDGVVASIVLTLANPTPPIGPPLTIPLTVTFFDASNAAIIGSAPFANPITLTDSDTSGATKLSQTAITAPSNASNVTVAYSGAPLAQAAVFNATAVGVPSGSITPATLTPQQTGPAGFVDWPTYAYDAQRSGFNPFSTAITPGSIANGQGLHLAWQVASTGHSTTQPIVVTNIAGHQAIVIIGNFNGAIAYDALTGATVWSTTLGTQNLDACGSSAPIAGTAAYDAALGAVFMAGGDSGSPSHVILYRMDVATGNVTGQVNVTPTLLPGEATFAHDAVTLANGLAYIGTGSNCEGATTGPPSWRGRVAAVDPGSMAVVNTFFTTYDQLGVGNVGGGGAWAWGGVSSDTSGNVYVATGNAETVDSVNQTPPPPFILTTDEQAGYAEHLVKLTANLSQVEDSNYPGFNFQIGYGDLDYAGTPVIYQPPIGSGCGLLSATQGKGGTLVINNTQGLTPALNSFALSVPSGVADYIGNPAYSPNTGLLYAPITSSGLGSSMLPPGLAAIGGCGSSLSWNTPFGPDSVSYPGPHPRSAPTVTAGGVVFMGTPCTSNSNGGCGSPGIANGAVWAVDATTGALLGGGNPLLVTPDSVLMAPTVDGQWVYVLDNSGNLYALTIDPSIPKIAAKPGRRSAASFMIRQ